MGMIISTDSLISSSEARKRLGQLLESLKKNEKPYFVILESGKIAAVLVPPAWIEEKFGNEFPNLNELRKEWEHSTESISAALNHLEKIPEKDLPELLR